MTFWIMLIIGALTAYKNRPPKAVGRLQPLLWRQPKRREICTCSFCTSRRLTRAPAVRGTPQPSPASVQAAVQAPIAVKPPTVRAPVVVTVSTQARLSALAALRRLGFSQKDAQAQLDTSLGLAIQQSLLTS
jgi:hypothetical protein